MSTLTRVIATFKMVNSDSPASLQPAPGGEPDRAGSLRRSVYALLIVSSLAAAAGRIGAVRSAGGETAMLSANDRSRWATIRALVDDGTYVIDDIATERHPITGQRAWGTIDLVRHRGWDGREHYYSSKPPLLATALAGEYWLLQRATGLRISEQPFYVMRIILLVSNLLPLAVYFCLLAGLVERHGTSDWGRLFVMSTATWGTFLSTFAVTLNNHLPAAISVLVTLVAVLRVWRDRDLRIGWFVLAGLGAAMAVANELPALSFFAVVIVALVSRSVHRTLIGFLPAMVVVGAAFFGTNYLAHGGWRVPYGHRGDGKVVASIQGDAAWVDPEPADDEQDGSDRARPGPVQAGRVEAGPIKRQLRARLAEAGVSLSESANIRPSAQADRWNLFDPESQNRYAIVRDGDRLLVRAWDQWYEYEQSYWISPKSGVDRGEPSRALYSLHVLIGHHGVFSLTPVWLLSMAGLVIWLRGGDAAIRGVALAVLAMTIVCLLFYVSRPLMDRNYGGVSCAFRWMIWLTPTWLLGLIPAADRVASRPWPRRLSVALLSVSVFSASYPAMNPWTHPWLYQYWDYLGWL